MPNIEEIPIIWKKSHNSANIFHMGSISILLHQFIRRYNKRLRIRRIIIDLEMPKDAAGLPDKTFIVKLHLILVSGTIVRTESNSRTIAGAMKDITRQIDNQTRSTDRQKHTDSTRKE